MVLRKNLLILVPQIRTPVYLEKTQITEAFYGEWLVSVPIRCDQNSVNLPTENVFNPNGRFFKYFPRENSTRFTRVSAVLCIEYYREEFEITHKALVLHNPFALNPISEALFSTIPQFVKRENQIILKEV